jgi:hypothetical protein
MRAEVTIPALAPVFMAPLGRLAREIPVGNGASLRVDAYAPLRVAILGC